jgi:hypothetical protein
MSSIRKRRAQKKNFQAVMILIAVISIVAIAIAGKVYIESTITKVDNETLCPIGKNTNRKIVLVDKTDPYSRVQKFALANALDVITENLTIGERLSIFVIDSDSQESMKPIFDACNPGDGSQVNALYQNPAKYKKRWDEMFIEPLEHVKRDLVNENKENQSPIFEMLQAVSLSALSDLSPGEDIELHIFSDMMHHTSGYSLYSKANLDPKILFDKPYYQKVMTDLHGADVHLHYIRRDGHESLQTNRNVVFWEKYFASINAKLSTVVRLDG